MQYFNFNNLIAKYESTFKAVLPSEGYYDESGEFVKGETKTEELTGAIISFKESKLFRSEGTLTTNDKRLFMLTSLGEILDGIKVIYDGRQYTVEESTDNAKFTGVYAYILRYVSAFKEDDR